MNLAGFWRVFSLMEREYDPDEETLRDRISQARDYVDARLYRAELMTPLPTNAPAGKLMVTTGGDINLYVGTGMTTPLRRIPTQPL